MCTYVRSHAQLLHTLARPVTWKQVGSSELHSLGPAPDRTLAAAGRIQVRGKERYVCPRSLFLFPAIGEASGTPAPDAGSPRTVAAWPLGVAA